MNKRPITAEDLLQFKFIGDPQVSPQGNRVAYVLTQLDKELNGYYSSIYVSGLEDEGRQYTYHYNQDTLIKDTAPKWSPDGKTLAFFSNRTGKNQVWILSIEGGEATPLTDVKQGISEFSWSPDGTQLAVCIKGELKQNLTQEEKEQQEKEEKEKSDVKQITRLRYKENGVGILNEDRKYVYTYDIATKQFTQITEGEFDFNQARFSPDGKSLIYLGSKDADQELEYIASIWKYDLETKKETKFFQGEGMVAAPSFSPDGKWIAFLGHNRGVHSSGNMQVWVISTSTGEARNLSETLDHTAGNLVGVDVKYDKSDFRLIWDEQSTAIYFLATIGGDCQLFKTNLDGQVSKALSANKANVTSFDLVDAGKAVLIQGNAHSPGDLIVQELTNIQSTQQISDWNKELLSEVSLSTPEGFTYKSTDGLEIEGWILKPFGFEEGKKYPMILEIHGGPHTSFGNGLHHEFQLMAAKGYVVLYTNPRGSHGYGHDFVNGVVGDYSGMDYEDIMAGVDYTIANFNFIDESQLFVTGGSYGGYMTNVIVTKTDRFKAAVTERSICNWHSFYGTSDIGFYFTHWQMGEADLWDDEEKLMKVSPIRYARNVKTPTLIIHSEQDLRCPIEQAEQWYVALRRLGVETKFVRFPDENHDLSRTGQPKHRLERLGHLIGWFEERTN